MAGLLACGLTLYPPSRPLAGQWRFGYRSPLTVAGAATVSVPDGYASPCSLFIRRAFSLAEPSPASL